MVIKVKPLSALGYLNLSMLSKPASDRALYKAIKKNKFRSIIEIGMGDGQRALNMIRTAKRFSLTPSIRYTGVDLFDARENGSPLPLIEMHRKLKTEDLKTQLVPGELASSIARIANSHVRTDMIVISAGFDEAELDSSWFFLPRMLHSTSNVFIQRDSEGQFQKMNRLQIEKLASNQTGQRSAAA